MALAMVAQGLHPGPAIAIAGRLAAPVIPAGGDPATVLLVHDSDDSYMPAALSEEAKARLAAAGHNVNLARTVGVSHGIGPATFTAIADWLAATASFQPNH
jgi:phospholipase/carboxylesterase